MTLTAHMDHDQGAPLWLKIVAGLGLVWYAFGLIQFWLGYSMDTVAAVSSGAITPAHGAAIDGTPGLVWLAFCAASAAGLLGACLLLARSGAARMAFAVSLVAAALYYLWVYVISGTGTDRPAEEMGIAAVVCAVTLGFWLLARRVG